MCFFVVYVPPPPAGHLRGHAVERDKQRKKEREREREKTKKESDPEVQREFACSSFVFMNVVPEAASAYYTAVSSA